MKNKIIRENMCLCFKEMGMGDSDNVDEPEKKLLDFSDNEVISHTYFLNQNVSFYTIQDVASSSVVSAPEPIVVPDKAKDFRAWLTVIIEIMILFFFRTQVLFIIFMISLHSFKRNSGASCGSDVRGSLLMYYRCSFIIFLFYAFLTLLN